MADPPRQTPLGRHPPGQIPPGRHPLGTYPGAEPPSQTLPPQETANEADCTHPAGMHSGLLLCYLSIPASLPLQFVDHSDEAPFPHYRSVMNQQASGSGSLVMIADRDCHLACFVHRSK